MNKKELHIIFWNANGLTSREKKLELENYLKREENRHRTDQRNTHETIEPIENMQLRHTPEGPQNQKRRRSSNYDREKHQARRITGNETRR
jgi:hypothetical protein